MKVRSFSDSVYLRCFLTLVQFRALHKGTGHTFSLARVPPRRRRGVNRVTLRSFEITASRYQLFTVDVCSTTAGALLDNYSTMYRSRILLGS